MNATLGLEGLVPSALVFGDFPVISTKYETAKPRATALSPAAVSRTESSEISKILEKFEWIEF